MSNTETQRSSVSSTLPAITPPKGGGAIRGLGEKFSVGSSTGAANFSIPIYSTPGRAGSSPELELSYDSGSGNSQFGNGWRLSLPSITRKTDKGIPVYDDRNESDVFVFSGAEDLVPLLEPSEDGEWSRILRTEREWKGESYVVITYRPRTETSFFRTERWTKSSDGQVHWQVTTPANVTSFFGESQKSQIFDPDRPERVFSWLLSRSMDDKGNVTEYHYKSEDSEGVDISKSHEAHRSEAARRTAKYVKRILYGNQTSRLTTRLVHSMKYHFEVVFDYGDHDIATPMPVPSKPWSTRPDPYSTYRSGFEIRMYRLCHRILVFHHFPDEIGVGNDCLVASTDLSYSMPRCQSFNHTEIQTMSLLSCVSKQSYVRRDGVYISDGIPPLEFDYTQPEISPDISSISHESLENLPVGVENTTYQWIDLDAEGIPGIISQQADSLFYSHNLGNGKFTSPEPLSSFPAISPTTLEAKFQWLDLEGGGKFDLVRLESMTPGFFKRDWTQASQWQNYRPFQFAPTINWSDSNTKFIDLTGDGLADVLQTTGEEFSWFASEGEAGFTFGGFWRPPHDEDKGPWILLSNPTESIYMADMTGDGLVDLLRVRNGEVCYWPNLGYGKFGSKVSMDNAPYFDDSTTFSQRRIVLGDIDGSGTTDIVYLHHSSATVYFNEAGNSWSGSHPIPSFPGYNDVDKVQLADILGQGTASLVWSSELPADSGHQIKYVNLMQQGKPYLLQKIVNNLGSESRIKYLPSTAFYLRDKAEGKPWLTRLPFPVQVVSESVQIDHLSGNVFSAKSTYHNGYFDDVEREFRGFGLTETIDFKQYGASEDVHRFAKNIDPSFSSPPVLTKSYYETGAYINGELISRKYAESFYAHDSKPSFLLGAPTLPKFVTRQFDTLDYDLSSDETREAYRVLKGSLLREEIYALDGTSRQEIPYKVSESRWMVKILQPQRMPKTNPWVPGMMQQKYNRHAIFFPHNEESVSFDYERNVSLSHDKSQVDPRREHTMTLKLDFWGNVLESLSINYGQRSPEHPVQGRSYVSLQVDKFTNALDEEDVYRTPIPWDSSTYQILGLSGLEGCSENLIDFGLTQNAISGFLKNPTEIPFEAVFVENQEPSKLTRRLISRTKNLMRADDFSGPLPFGKQGRLAIPYESYTQVLTPGLVEIVGFDHDEIRRGGFVTLRDDPNWWSPSGKTFYSPNSKDDPQSEFDYASRHFFLSCRFRDPFFRTDFDTETFATWDKYSLLPLETRDAKDNRITVGMRNDDMQITPGYDYRTLQAQVTMDPNRNVDRYSYDILGRVSASAFTGKLSTNEGDELSGFPIYVSEIQRERYFERPLHFARELLGNATQRYIYDDWAYYRSKSAEKPHPPVVSIILREKHISQLASGEESGLRISFHYNDGLSRSIQVKALADPDLETQSTRWLCSGWKVYNNKGSTVKEYEPLYSTTHAYQVDAINGVSSITMYDPLQRSIAKLNPNHSWSKTLFTPWAEQAWDCNDTVLARGEDDTDLRGYFERLSKSEYSPTWYENRIDGEMGPEERQNAEKTSIHANTPSTSYFDALGRTVVTVSLNRFRSFKSGEPMTERLKSEVDLDISGNIIKTWDQHKRLVQVAKYSMTGVTLKNDTMEAGTTWDLPSVTGNPSYARDIRGFEQFWHYDESQRPIYQLLADDSEKVRRVTVISYGEGLPNAESLNVRGRQVAIKDQACIRQNNSYDFKGNLLEQTHHVVRDYQTVTDWNTDVELESKTFTRKMTFDALNRVLSSTEADGSIICNEWNKLDLLKRVSVQIRGAGLSREILCRADYNARAQKLTEILGNGTETNYVYDPLTFNMKGYSLHRHSSNNISRRKLLDLHYVIDPSNNVTASKDDGQDEVFFRQHLVKPKSEYEYDALYRLIKATGRERMGLGVPSRSSGSPDVISKSYGNETKALVNYVETYKYDAVGNILVMAHDSLDDSQRSWTRRYHYEEPSQLDPTVSSDRLSRTSVGGIQEACRYDGNAGLMGNISSMPGFNSMQWDFKNQLHATSTQISESEVPETTWYSYKDDGSRLRKLTTQTSHHKHNLIKKHERLYIGQFESYLEYDTRGALRSQVDTLRIDTGASGVVMIETRENEQSEASETTIRYQYSNVDASSVLELSNEADVLTYEEYYPYGSTSYQAISSQLEIPKRYRFFGKERDLESGLYYFGARYYASWLGRWINPDPGGFADGPNLYQFVRSNPISRYDSTGRQAAPKLPAAPPATPEPPLPAEPPVRLVPPAPPEPPVPTAPSPPPPAGVGGEVGEGLGELATQGERQGLRYVVGDVLEVLLGPVLLILPLLTLESDQGSHYHDPWKEQQKKDEAERLRKQQEEAQRQKQAEAQKTTDASPAPQKKDDPNDVPYGPPPPPIAKAPTPKPPGAPVIKPKPKPKTVTKTPTDDSSSKEWHHVLPQAFAWFFKKAGINIHEAQFGVMLPKWVHDIITYGVAYNLLWKLFILHHSYWDKNGHHHFKNFGTNDKNKIKAQLIAIAMVLKALTLLLPGSEPAKKNHRNYSDHFKKPPPKNYRIPRSEKAFRKAPPRV